jgi:selenocysteine lyase/cysteine desulfurase
MERRKFLQNTSLIFGATVGLSASANVALGNVLKKKISYESWDAIRAQFNLSPSRIHMSQMLLASHPAPVREAIENHRRKFDENPFEYWESNFEKADKIVCDAAAKYLRVTPEEIALTDSTTMGLAMLYNGLKLKAGDEILTTTHDHYATEKSIEFAAAKTGATIRRVSLYSDPAKATVDEIVDIIAKAIKPSTRVIALTWVHSVSGVKIPIARIGEVVKKENGRRGERDRIYYCVDGVHALGIENVDLYQLGCDFLPTRL